MKQIPQNTHIQQYTNTARTHLILLHKTCIFNFLYVFCFHRTIITKFVNNELSFRINL